MPPPPPSRPKHTMKNSFAPLKPQKTPLQTLEEEFARERTDLLKRLDTSEAARKDERKRRKRAETERDELADTVASLKRELKKRKHEQPPSVPAARRHVRALLLKTHPDHHAKGELDPTELTQDLNRLLELLTAQSD